MDPVHLLCARADRARGAVRWCSSVSRDLPRVPNGCSTSSKSWSGTLGIDPSCCDMVARIRTRRGKPEPSHRSVLLGLTTPSDPLRIRGAGCAHANGVRRVVRPCGATRRPAPTHRQADSPRRVDRWQPEYHPNHPTLAVVRPSPVLGVLLVCGAGRGSLRQRRDPVLETHSVSARELCSMRPRQSRSSCPMPRVQRTHAPTLHTMSAFGERQARRSLSTLQKGKDRRSMLGLRLRLARAGFTTLP